jgi:hypothetical protein
MKIRKNGIGDEFFYYAFCILSLGLVFFIRIIITNAIKQALDNDKITTS